MVSGSCSSLGPFFLPAGWSVDIRKGHSGSDACWRWKTKSSGRLGPYHCGAAPLVLNCFSSLRPPHSQRVAKRTWHIAVLVARIYYSHVVKIHSQTIKDKDTGGGIHVQTSLRSLPPRKNHTPLTLSPTMKMQQHVCDVSMQGSPIET